MTFDSKTGYQGNGSYQRQNLLEQNFFSFLECERIQDEKTMDKRPKSVVCFPRPRNISNIE